ncbi:hypothetical protein Bca4012_025693 [Brassica carinata]
MAVRLRSSNKSLLDSFTKTRTAFETMKENNVVCSRSMILGYMKFLWRMLKRFSMRPKFTALHILKLNLHETIFTKVCASEGVQNQIARDFEEISSVANFCYRRYIENKERIKKMLHNNKGTNREQYKHKRVSGLKARRCWTYQPQILDEKYDGCRELPRERRPQILIATVPTTSKKNPELTREKNSSPSSK